MKIAFTDGTWPDMRKGIKKFQIGALSRDSGAGVQTLLCRQLTHFVLGAGNVSAGHCRASRFAREQEVCRNQNAKSGSRLMA